MPKVRYNKIIQRYNKGGLKLVDLYSKSFALKATWVSRWKHNGALNSPQYAWIYSNLPLMDERIWLTNLSQKDVNKHIVQGIDMSSQILAAWVAVNFEQEINPQLITQTPLWGNSMIRRNNEPYLNQSLLKTNVDSISQICDFHSKKILSLHRDCPISWQATL